LNLYCEERGREMDIRKGRILKLAIIIYTCFLSFIFLGVAADSIFSNFIKVIFWILLYGISLVIGIIVLIFQPLYQIIKTPKEARYEIFGDDIRFNFKSTLIIHFVYTATVIGPFISGLQTLNSSWDMIILGLIFPFPLFLFTVIGVGMSILLVVTLLSIMVGFLPLSTNVAVTLIQLKICKKISLLKVVTLGLFAFVPFVSLIVNVLCVVWYTKRHRSASEISDYLDS
jgi:hypothetical protein